MPQNSLSITKDRAILEEKWGKVVSTPKKSEVSVQEIKDKYRRDTVIQIMENTQNVLNESSSIPLFETPINTQGGGNIATWDPVLISLIRRAMPNLMAYDICGVQPMTGPTGLIFCMRSKYTSQASGSITDGVANNEAFFNEADTSFSGRQSGMSGYIAHQGSNPFSTYTTGLGMTTAQAEGLGPLDGSPYQFNEMAFSIDKVNVTAVTRALAGSYSQELAQDLKAIHGMDVETELANIISTEILAEINREVVRKLYYIAKPGAQKGTTTPGIFDLDTDSNGRWLEEKFKGLLYYSQRDANQIARETRRGKGNFMVCSSDVASALSMTGQLTYAPALETNLTVDDTGNTFAGVLKNNMKVFIDPYFDNSGMTDTELMMVGYKGSSPYDAGFFYCPYVPLQMVRAVGERDFQPKIGFKCRQGMVSNPFYTDSAGSITATSNPFYRIIQVVNLT